MDVKLKDLDRDQLNELAPNKGIADPAAYGKKDELVAAIEAAEAGEPIPEPKDKASGTTVTFKGCPAEPGCRSVRAGDDRFLIDTPVHGVDKATVEQLKALEGHEFEFDG
jgi:hypothetical protein